MVTHIRYFEASYHSAVECLSGIRLQLERGCWLSALEGPRNGTYTATFGLDTDGVRLLEPS